MVKKFWQMFLSFWQKFKIQIKNSRIFLLPPKKSRRMFLILFILVFVAGVAFFWQMKSAAALDIMKNLYHLVNYLLYGICYVLGWVAMKIFALIIVISFYNDFVNSPAVTKGWVLIRDACNLFFVLALLMVAFAQILQLKEYSGMDKLKKIIVAAVLVNFSKLICALIIDFGQVVMLTFVNGYAATAGGNLINGLGLQKVLQLSSDNADGANTGTDNLELMAALALAIIVLIMTIIVTFYILILLTMRIVQLWLLIVISPLAFLSSAIPIKNFSIGPVQNFWSTFGWSVAVGPFMAFFLWLSLLMMANPEQMIKVDDAQLAKKESGSKVKGTASVINNMVQALIGIAMLLGALDIASKAGGIVGAQASKMQDKAKSVAMTISGVNKARSLADKAEKKVADTATAAYNKTVGYGKKVGAAITAPITVPAKMAYGAIKEQAGKLKEATVGKMTKALKARKEKVLNKLRDRIDSKDGGKTGKVMAQVLLGVAMAPSKAGLKEAAYSNERKKKQSDEKIKQGQDSLKNRGIKSKKDLQNVLSDSTEDQNSKMAAAAQLAEKGFMDKIDPRTGKVIKKASDFAKEAKALLAGNEEAIAKINKKVGNKDLREIFDLKDEDQVKQMIEGIANGDFDLKKQKRGKDGFLNDPAVQQVLRKEMRVNKDLQKQIAKTHAHFAYNQDNPEDMEKMQDDFDHGDIKLADQDDAFFEDGNQNLICSAQRGLGTKKFKAQMKAVLDDDKRSHEFEGKTKGVLAKMAGDKRQQVKALKAKNPAVDSAEHKEMKLGEKELANITALTQNLAASFGSGSVAKPKNRAGQDVAEASNEMVLDQDMKDSFVTYVESMSADDLSDLEIGDKKDGDKSGVLPHLVRYLRVNQLSALAEKKSPKMELLVGEIVKQCETVVDDAPQLSPEILKNIVSNSKIMDGINDPEILSKLKKFQEPVADNEKRVENIPVGYEQKDGQRIITSKDGGSGPRNNGGNPRRGKIDIT